MGINFKIGRTRYWFSDRKGADRHLDEMQERIDAHKSEVQRLTKLRADMRKAIESVDR